MSSSRFSSASATIAIAWPSTSTVVEEFIDKHYERTGKVFRRCHPRDVLSHAINLMQFEKLPYEITPKVLDRAFESCFLAEEGQESEPRRRSSCGKPAQPCSVYLAERFAADRYGLRAAGRRASFHDPELTREYPRRKSRRRWPRCTGESSASGWAWLGTADP